MKPGEQFCAIEKGQGLEKGERVKRLALLECVSNRSEPLCRITQDAVVREGFPDLDPYRFTVMFCELNHCRPGQAVNVIAFKYVKPAVEFITPDHPVCTNSPNPIPEKSYEHPTLPTLPAKDRHHERHNAQAYFCPHCRIEFEPESDGDIGYGDPARIAERREQREIREKRQASEARRAKLRGGLGR